MSSLVEVGEDILSEFVNDDDEDCVTDQSRRGHAYSASHLFRDILAHMLIF